MKIDQHFEETLINVYNYDSNTLLHKGVSLSKTSRILNIGVDSVWISIYKTKKKFYKNRKTGIKYRFELIKNNNA
jgi:hypothetical protein